MFMHICSRLDDVIKHWMPMPRANVLTQAFFGF